LRRPPHSQRSAVRSLRAYTVRSASAGHSDRALGSLDERSPGGFRLPRMLASVQTRVFLAPDPLSVPPSRDPCEQPSPDDRIRPFVSGYLGPFVLRYGSMELTPPLFWIRSRTLGLSDRTSPRPFRLLCRVGLQIAFRGHPLDPARSATRNSPVPRDGPS
jgi:hypothetical protein